MFQCQILFVIPLKKLNYKSLKNKQLAPHEWTVPIYGKNRQCAKPENTSTLLDQKGKTRVKSVVGSFLYYGRAVDNTILPSFNEISLQQAAPTENTNKKIQMLLDYLNTFSDAKIHFYALDMQLFVDSDAAFIVALKVKRCIAGFFYFSNPTVFHH